jgi:octopine/nopaline transport system permease protein
MIDPAFMADVFMQLIGGVPLMLQLVAVSVAAGAVLAIILAMARLSGIPALDWLARAYVFVFRGTPLLVQVFLIYYGLAQFADVRQSFLWPFLRQPYWCAILAFTLNTAAYGSEIVRGGILSVPAGQVEAARAFGMSGVTLFRRIIGPIALRQALPSYGSEIILMVKATSLASIITLAEVTGIAHKLISQTFRAIEIFLVAGAIYLAINFLVTRIVALVERRLSPDRAATPRSGSTDGRSSEAPITH